MMLLQTILAFAVVLGVLVIVHELGHYLVARWCGVKVLRFSVGMGKVVYSRRFGADQTEWAVSILPLGGYVKMLDARDDELGDISPEDMKREFTRQSVWRRIAIVAAGPIANFLLAIAVFAGLYSYGIPEPAPKLRAPAEKSVAYQAGLRGNELVTSVNGEPVQIWNDLRWQMVQSVINKQPVRLEVESPVAGAPDAKHIQTITLPVDSISPNELEGDFLGKLGIDLARPPAVLGQVVPDGPAMKAGLQQGDRVLRVNGAPITDGLSLVELVRASPGKNLEVDVLRNGQPVSLRVVPDEVNADGQTFGRIKVEVPMAPDMVVAHHSLFGALLKGVQKTWDTSVLTIKMVGKMIIGEVSWKNVTGPITIADYAGQTARIGWISYLSFIAFVSISLGVMNLLPIPVLDGGLLLYYAVEVLTGRPVSERFGAIAQRAGIGILMTLMLVAVFNDINRLIS
ncbi:RIP metalloprotease RseP [Herminiimonas sp. KBW02]|uniref:RIP metalloprotease RseP n=1 Tax=Herminiimonas sp. KBW02 TaxID=2153363 RepID=UPI000F59AA78|nr:RIP metalloprotease RseP [Herminiimonas sp. KBW02]RQO36266.1 RIP metalloprotease RseP [Herminiimonas sp. KBW02]